jgi:Integrase zinc binding domain/Integrase core domain
MGHPGRDKLLADLRTIWWWPRMRDTIEEVLSRCPSCQAEKIGAPPREAYRATIRPPLPGRGWSIDLAGPFPADVDGNRYLAVAVDCLTKWVEVRPLPSKHAFRCAEWLYADIFARWGKPDWIRTDNGAEWDGVFAKLVEHWGVHHSRITVGNSKANG